MTLPGLTLPEFKRLIVDSLRLEGVAPEAIPDDGALFGAGLGLDSVDALELVVAVERKLGIKLRAHEMDRDAFSTARKLLQAIEHQVG